MLQPETQFHPITIALQTPEEVRVLLHRMHINLGTADKPVSVTNDNVLNFIATALFVNRANMKPIEFPEAFGKWPSASFHD